MHHDQPCILILEDDKFTSKLVYSALHQKFKDLVLITAYDIDQARILCQHLDVDVVLCDVYLPDGHGMDFVFDLMMGNPLLQVIVISSAQQPEIHKRAKDMGSVHFLTKPVEVDPLYELMQRTLSGLSLPAKKANAFKARLSQLTPLDLVQMKCLSNATQILEFQPEDGPAGLLYFRDGRIVHAEVGGILGEDAFFTILSWQGGVINELPLPDHYATTISCDWQSLLMRAAHELDTKAKPPTDGREHTFTKALPKPDLSRLSPNASEAKKDEAEPEVVGEDRAATLAKENGKPEKPEAPANGSPMDTGRPPKLELDELLITNSKGGVRASFGLDTNQALEFAAHLATMRPEVHRILKMLKLGPLDKVEFANSTRGAMLQLDTNGSVLALGPTQALHEKRLMKNAIFMMEQLL